MSMDPWLATVYGTNGGAAEDLEKIAQAEMAQQMAAQEGIDLSQLSPEQIAQLGQEVLGPEGQQQGGEGEISEEMFQEAQQVLANPEQFDPAIVEQAQGIMAQVEQMQAQGGQQQMGQPQQGQPQMGAPGAEGGQPQMGVPGAQPGQAEMAKVAEAQAKFEEADFLGRVMAHSFNQESEKIAAAKQAGAMEHLRGAGHAVAGAGHAAMGHLKHLGGAVKHHAGQAAGAVKHHAGAAAHHLKTHPGLSHGLAAGAGAAGGAAAMHHMNKEATVNAIEQAAMAKAASILQQNGIDPATGQPLQPQGAPAPAPAAAPVAPQVNPQQALGELVEKRAHQILRSLGYTVE